MEIDRNFYIRRDKWGYRGISYNQKNGERPDLSKIYELVDEVVATGQGSLYKEVIDVVAGTASELLVAGGVIRQNGYIVSTDLDSLGLPEDVRVQILRDKVIKVSASNLKEELPDWRSSQRWVEGRSELTLVAPETISVLGYGFTRGFNPIFIMNLESGPSYMPRSFTTSLESLVKSLHKSRRINLLTSKRLLVDAVLIECVDKLGGGEIEQGNFERIRDELSRRRWNVTSMKERSVVEDNDDQEEVPEYTFEFADDIEMDEDEIVPPAPPYNSEEEEEESGPDISRLMLTHHIDDIESEITGPLNSAQRQIISDALKRCFPRRYS